MAIDSDSKRTLAVVLVGRDRATARRFSLAAVVTLGVFAVLFSLLAWNVFDESSTLVFGVWALLGGWTLCTPIVSAYRDGGLLVSWLLASVGPFAVGAVLARSPALTGAQRALVDVLGFAVELSVAFGLPVGAIGFAIGSGVRIAGNRWLSRTDVN